MRIFVKNKKDKMRSTAEYITILRDYMTKNASKYSITRMGIFGSVARGEQTEDSDVDVYLETSQPNMGTSRIHGAYVKLRSLEC